jgi:putative transposase
VVHPRAHTPSSPHRQIGSTRRECLDWMLILGRRHLERVVRGCSAPPTRERPHRALDLQLPIPRSEPVSAVGPVICRERLGGLLRDDRRAQLTAAA